MRRFLLPAMAAALLLSPGAAQAKNPLLAPKIVPICDVDPVYCRLSKLSQIPFVASKPSADAFVESASFRRPGPVLAPVNPCIDGALCRAVFMPEPGAPSAMAAIGLFRAVDQPLSDERLLSLESSSTSTPAGTAAGAPALASAGASPVPAAASPASAVFEIGRQTAGTAAEQQGPCICNNPDVRPISVWREAALSRIHNISKACSEPANRLLEMRKYALYEKVILEGQPDNGPLFNYLTQTIDQYVSACLDMFDDVATSTPGQRMFGANFRDAVYENVGTLRLDDDKMHCMASLVRIDDGAANSHLALLTAMHCLGRIAPAGSRMQIARVYTRLHFRTLSGKEFAVNVLDDMYAYQFSNQNDVVLVPLKQTDADQALELKGLGLPVSSSAQLWDPLYILSVNPIAMARSELASATAAEKRLKSVTISIEPSCRIYGMDGRELFHNCQTEHAMSGSPVLVVSDQGATVLAVHTGEAGVPQPCPGKSVPGMNMAVMLPSNLQ